MLEGLGDHGPNLIGRFSGEPQVGRRIRLILRSSGPVSRFRNSRSLTPSLGRRVGCGP
jgi:hypothetical protein